MTIFYLVMSDDGLMGAHTSEQEARASLAELRELGYTSLRIVRKEVALKEATA